MSNAATNPYDEVPFPSQPLRHTQPNRLEAIAAMFGMRPAPSDRCRALELGCATGGNLIPLAARYPLAEFVGVDYSAVQIEAARRGAAALGLANLELRCASITDLGPELGQFDYIICHGVYTWVPRDVQDAILSLCRKTLSRQGVAYVSYNTYPAWHLRSLARRLMRGPSASAPGHEQVARGRARLNWLATAIADDQTPFGRLLTIELDAILQQPDEYLFHEYFEGDNEPLYFHEFVDRAAAAELQYLGDAEPTTMFAANYGRETAERLQRVADDPISTEQHLDVLCNRGFRKTLLCHREVTPSRRLLPEALERSYVSGKFVPRGTAIDLKTWSQAEFTTASGSKIAHAAPPVKALLYHLGAEWPRSHTIDELTAAVAESIAPAGQSSGSLSEIRQIVIPNLVQCVTSGLVDVSSTADAFTTAVSRYPQVGELARLQARGGPIVTNCRHESVELDEMSRGMLTYLDGQHDQDALLAELVCSIERGDIPASGATTDRTTLATTLQHWLTTLAGQALLVS